MDNKKRYRKPRLAPYAVAAILVIVFGVFVEWLAIFELKNYEDKFLLVYGDEQDGYVQVTIDQIERLGAGASEADVTNIIASIDTSQSRYWTLTKDDNILFVKSVTETSRYKNLTAESYYNVDSSISFINSLDVGKVSHSIIFIDDDRYIASGGKFVWNGDEYTICLITYDYAILDQNELLEAKNIILVFVTVLVAIFICFIMISLHNSRKKKANIFKLEDDIVDLNITINRMHEILLNYESYTAKFHTYYERTLPLFLENLYEKKVSPLFLALFDAGSPENEEKFLDKMILTMDESVIRFKLDDGHVLIIFVGSEEKVGVNLVKTLDCVGVSLIKSQSLKYDETETYQQQYDRFKGEM